MMDYQEAIETVQDIHDVAETRIKSGDDRGVVYIPRDELNNIKTAISAMQELQQYKQIGTLEEVREAVERQRPRKAILKNGKSGMFVDYADGHGEYKVTKWQDWCCPVCGWFVGQRYNASQGRSHDQRKSEYCNECGQHIDWSEEDEIN